MQERHTDFAIGETVDVRGSTWRVVDKGRFAFCERLDLAALDDDRERTCALLYPFDRPARVTPGPPRVVPAPALGRAFAAAAQRAHPWGALNRTARASIELYPYQLEPAMAIVRGLATRVLLADEVGLGKTIQAGVVLDELRARGLARRALVLTPAGLRDQWAGELDRRFGIGARVVDAWHLGRAAAGGANPWALDGLFIVSCDFVKRPEVLRGLESLSWDLVIVDEAHAVSGASDRHLAVDGVCRRARRVVLLTATPHTGSDESYRRLCALGQIGGEDRDPVALFRRTRASLGLGRRRRVGLLRIAPSEPGRRMHRLLERYAREVWREAGARGDGRLAMIVLRKRALSCAASLLISVDRRRQLLEAGRDDCPSQLALPLDADLTREDVPPDEVLGAPGLANQPRERAWLGAIAAAARRAARHERKLAVLARLVGRTREPAIVFTEYRDTLDLIEAAIGRVTTVAAVHGGMTRHERAASLAAFNAGRARVLVATDAAGQGLNLQERCRWVIDFELPWTPARIEQRIGRVDRLGQTRPVHALHLVARDTAEALVAARLLGRERRARAALGSDDTPPPFPEEAMAALVMGEGVMPDMAAPSSGLAAHTAASSSAGRSAGHAVRRAAQAEARRLAWLRSLSRLAGRSAADRPSVGAGVLVAALGQRARTASRAPRPTGVVLVYRVAVVDAAGRPVEASLVPVLVRTAAGPAGRSATATRAWLEAIVDRSGADAAAHASGGGVGRLAGLMRRQRPAISRWMARERALASVLGVPVARSLLQPGLFDRRAVRDAERARRAARVWTTETAARLDELEAGGRLSAVPPRLLMAIVCPDINRLFAPKAVAGAGPPS